MVAQYDFCEDADIGIGMKRSEGGDWVEYGDYYDLEKKYEKLVKMVEELYREV